MDWNERQTQLTLDQLWRRVSCALAPLPIAEQELFERCLRRERPGLFGLLISLYKGTTTPAQAGDSR